MWKNYLTIAIRNLRKDKLNSLVNIFGLSIGLACSILILLFVRNEFSYDTFHSKSERIYRACTEDLGELGEDGRIFPFTSALLGETLQQDLPEIERYIRMTSNIGIVRLEDNMWQEEISMFDSGFFQVFDFNIIFGSTDKALYDPKDVVLSEEYAKKYFGNSNPVGELLTIELGSESVDFIVKAVIENPPSNSSIDYSIIMSYANARYVFPERMINSWFSIFGETYLLLREGIEPESLRDSYSAIIEKALGDHYEDRAFTIFLQPVKDIHLNTEISGMFSASVDPKYIYILSGIAIMILIIGIINFTTLSIARSISRSREVGVRKVAGASKNQLIAQFLAEAMITAFISMIVGVIVARFVLPVFNKLANQKLLFDLGYDNIMFIVFIVLIVGLISGSYPAFVISSFRPTVVLKGSLKVGAGKQTLRKGMVVMQNIVTVVFISAALIMTAQLNFLQNKYLGFMKEQVAIVPINVESSQGLKVKLEKGMEKALIVKNELVAIPGIESVGLSVSTFEGGSWIRIGSLQDGMEPEDMKVFSVDFVDPDYITTMKMEIVKGRNFSKDIESDFKNAFLVNEELVREMEWEMPLNEQLPGRYESHEIIGVVQDFNYESLHRPIRPLFFSMNINNVFESANSINIESFPYPRLYIRLKSDKIPATLKEIETKVKQLHPDVPYEVNFLDDTLNKQYEADQNLNKIVKSASFLAIVIGCLGLFTISMLNITARTKEIGIRKALGASIETIFMLLLKEFVIIVVVATILASPVTYYFLNEWLTAFEYRIDINPLIFILAGLITLLLAFLTVGSLSLKAAHVNPVRSLRYE